MARENIAFLHGQIMTNPKIYQTEDGILTRAITAIKVLRRPYINGNGEVLGGKLYVDCPIIMTGNEDFIRKFLRMQQGDMIDIKGVLTTREVTKSTICKKCGHKNSVLGNSVYITPIYVCKREEKLDTMAGFEILKERNEISNMFILMGNLCRPPQFFADESFNYSTCQYQIAVNRKYHIRDMGTDERTDYPWIKSFGQQAKQDALRLREGATIYVNGGMQTREIVRSTQCEECGAEYTWKDTASEIIPYSVEYLTGCNFPEREEKDKEDEAQNDELEKPFLSTI